MSLSREGSHSADLQPGWLDDDELNLWMTFLEHDSQYSSIHDALSSPPYAEADALQNIPSHGSNLHGDLDSGEHLRDSLAGLELSGSDGLLNSEMSDSTFGRTSNIGTVADPSQNVPGRIDPVLSSESASSRMYRAHTFHTPYQSINVAGSSPPWRPSVHWSEESSANPHPHTYTTHQSSAATYSQYSNSAWETDPPTPSAEDSDSRPMPDDNSASMQSYNDPQTGIWPQGNNYGQCIMNLGGIGMRHGNGINSNVIRLLPQSLQEVFANADAATPFGTDSPSNGGSLLVNGSLDVRGVTMAAPSLSLPSTSGGSVLRFSEHPEVEHFFLPSGSGHKLFPKIALMIASENPPLPATTLPPAMSMDPPASAASPPASAGTSNTGVSRCSHRGCRAKFTGVSRKDNLRRHKRLDHGNEPRPICPECHLVIQSGRRDNLKRHIREKHPGHPLLASLNVRGKKAGSKTAVIRKSAKGKRGS